MATTFELQAEKRQDFGKAAARRIRRLEDKIPAIMYGAGINPQPLNLQHNKVAKALENEGFYSNILIIDVDGKKERAILRAIQRHPYKPKIMHMDFQRISETEKLTMNIPLHFIGEDIAPGVADSGGIISHLLTTVEVSCLPSDLPQFIEVDVSKLNLDESIHLSDLKLPKNVELVQLAHGPENDLSIVNIHLPRAALSSASTESVEVPASEQTSEEGSETPK